MRHSPPLRDGSRVSDDLSVVAPSVQDGAWRANTGTSWVAAWTEPVVLRCSCGPGTESVVCGAVDRGGKDLLGEQVVVGDARGGQVVRDVFQYLEEVIDVSGTVLNDDLEWTEELGHKEISLLLTPEVLDGHQDRRGLVRSINTRYAMVSERHTTEQ